MIEQPAECSAGATSPIQNRPRGLFSEDFENLARGLPALQQKVRGRRLRSYMKSKFFVWEWQRPEMLRDDVLKRHHFGASTIFLGTLD